MGYEKPKRWQLERHFVIKIRLFLKVQKIIKQSWQLFGTVNFAFMKIFDFLVKIAIFRAFLLFWEIRVTSFCPDQMFEVGHNA